MCFGGQYTGLQTRESVNEKKVVTNVKNPPKIGRVGTEERVLSWTIGQCYF